jgi:Flp pilus assembly protein TadG
MLLRRGPVRAKRGGATTVEMAMVIGICLLLMFGIIEYSRFVFWVHTAQNAAREGARFAVVRTGNVLQTSDINAIKGNMTDMAAYQSGTVSWASGSTIRGVVNTMMSNQQNALVSGTYAVDAYQADPTTGQPINTTVSASPWSDAPFGGSMCVQVKGTYRFYAASLLKFTNADVPVTINAFMSSEAN